MGSRILSARASLDDDCWGLWRARCWSAPRVVYSLRSDDCHCQKALHPQRCSEIRERTSRIEGVRIRPIAIFERLNKMRSKLRRNRIHNKRVSGDDDGGVSRRPDYSRGSEKCGDAVHSESYPRRCALRRRGIDSVGVARAAIGGRPFPAPARGLRTERYRHVRRGGRVRSRPIA